MIAKTIRILPMACLLLCCACETARVHRLTDFEYIPKGENEQIDLFSGPPVDRPFEPIAIVDSKRYRLGADAPDEDKMEQWVQNPSPTASHAAAREKMYGELEGLARQLGGDAVHKIRLLTILKHGMIPDEIVPVPGAVKQGFHNEYILRGEVIKYYPEPETETG